LLQVENVVHLRAKTKWRGEDLPKLTTADMKLIDNLFGMYSGFVMNFTNKRFDSFFKRDIGVNIYDDAYAIHGTSKGKRLLAFLEVAQTPAIIKALHALWEYREAAGGGEVETMGNARARLGAIIEKLGGKPLPADPRPHKSILRRLRRAGLPRERYSSWRPSSWACTQ
jgi:hypothetical protein